jgi:hypothetical protein
MIELAKGQKPYHPNIPAICILSKNTIKNPGYPPNVFIFQLFENKLCLLSGI